jgi:hypothetical protein
MSDAGPAQQTLPLFPLEVVLFPGATLPLHIFEPRYKQMLNHCLAGDQRFGVVLIAAGQEVGSVAVPHRVGTIARIVRTESLSDGRAHLVTVGERRFAIEQNWLHEAGYLVGTIRPRVEVIDTPAIELAADVAGLRLALIDYIGRLAPGQTSVQTELEAVTDAIHLTGVATSLLSADTRRLQAILEQDSAPTRLRQVHALVRQELALLDLLGRPTDAALERGFVSPN